MNEVLKTLQDPQGWTLRNLILYATLRCPAHGKCQMMLTAPPSAYHHESLLEKLYAEPLPDAVHSSCCAQS